MDKYPNVKKLLMTIADLFKVKTIVTLALTGTMVAVMFYKAEINREMLMLFSSTYGAVITYFFTRKESGEK